VEVAAAPGVNDDTVRRWIGAGLLTARRGERGRRLVDGLAAARRRAPADAGEGEQPRTERSTGPLG
jgi:hypothetical protein